MTRHCTPITKTPCMAASTIAIILQGITDIIDRILLAQRQWAWKAPFGGGGIPL